MEALPNELDLNHQINTVARTLLDDEVILGLSNTTIPKDDVARGSSQAFLKSDSNLDFGLAVFRYHPRVDFHQGVSFTGCHFVLRALLNLVGRHRLKLFSELLGAEILLFVSCPLPPAPVPESNHHEEDSRYGQHSRDPWDDADEKRRRRLPPKNQFTSIGRKLTQLGARDQKIERLAKDEPRKQEGNDDQGNTNGDKETVVVSVLQFRHRSVPFSIHFLSL